MISKSPVLKRAAGICLLLRARSKATRPTTGAKAKCVPISPCPALSANDPNAVVAGKNTIYVSNGNNDSITMVDARTLRVRGKINLSVLDGADARLKGVQPVSLALDASERTLYVAEAGINAVGVINVDCDSPRVVGLIPTGWWPAS